jgi:hypothetical protein
MARYQADASGDPYRWGSKMDEGWHARRDVGLLPIPAPSPVASYVLPQLVLSWLRKPWKYPASGQV